MKPHKFSNKLLTLLITGVMVLSVLEITAQDGEAIFKQTCTACHTVGKGRLVGPDLQGVTNKRSEEWLIKFIKSSQTMINNGDADAKAIFEEYNKVMMPDQNLSDAEVKAVISYISANSPQESGDAGSDAATEEVVIEEEIADAEPARTSADATEEEIAMGAQLFSGEKAFKNGGAACLSCHNVDYDGIMGGGLLAKDLTTVHERLGGDAGVGGILKSPPFPAMTETYKDRDLTEEEVYQLTAFLNHVNQEKIYQHHRSYTGIFTYGGGTGLLILLCLIYFIWFKRKKETVKKDIYKRQLKSY